MSLSPSEDEAVKLDQYFPDFWIPRPDAWIPSDGFICFTGTSNLMAKVGTFLGYVVHTQVHKNEKEEEDE